MDILLSFAAALVSLRLAGLLLHARRYAWAGGLASFAAAAGAMAWGAAHGWDAYAFRAYYLAGALLSAPLLGVGSLQLWGRRWASALGWIWLGLSVGLAMDVHVHGPWTSMAVPRAQDHLHALPRMVAIVGSSLGTIAVVVVAAVTFRRRPVGTGLLVAAIAAAAAGSALTQTAVAAAATAFAAASALLYLSATRRG